MPKKGQSKYVKKITSREEKLFLQLAKTGIAISEQAEKYCNLKIPRLKKLHKSKYIKLTEQVVDGKRKTVIQLDSKGKIYIRENFLHNGKLAQAQINHLQHDLKLTDKYYKLPEGHRRTFISERDLIKEIYIKKPYLVGKLENCIDGLIEVDGERIGIEVIGKSYTQKDINMKILIAKTYLNCEKIEWII